MFLNVDLDLRGNGLEELLGYLGSSVLVMHQAAQQLSLELSDSCNDPLDVTLAKWIELIQSLPEPARAHLGPMRASQHEHRYSKR
jgi:hypothetical protein